MKGSESPLFIGTWVPNDPRELLLYLRTQMNVGKRLLENEFDGHYTCDENECLYMNYNKLRRELDKLIKDVEEGTLYK